MGRASSSDIDEVELTKQDRLDRDQLAQLGKKSVLKRTFGSWTVVGFSCTVLITWEGAQSLFAQGLYNGGPAGTIYSFIFVWLGNLSVFAALSELVSMAPTAGGQYHWVSMLAPRSCSKFLSYITGWLSVSGWQGTVASACFITGSMIQGLITTTVPSYEPQPYQTVLLYWAVILFCVLVNSVGTNLLAKFEGTALVVHVTGFVAIFAALFALGVHTDATTVFTSWNNGGNWPSQGLSFFIGAMGNVFAFVGVDAAYHLCEETHNPSVIVPRSIMFSIVINGATGLAMTIATLFCTKDLIKATTTPTGFPFMEIYLEATENVAGAAAMSSVILIMGICATTGIVASTSRVFWSFARDRGLPAWRTLSKVHSRTTVPLWSIACTAVISVLLSLINFGSTAAFNDVISLSVSGLYGSYLMAAGLLLYRRCGTGFRMPDATSHPALAGTDGEELSWGPWHIPGALGIVNNTIACIYLVIIWFFSFFPQGTPVTPLSMNFSVVVTGGVTIFSIVYYLVWAKKEYVGPVMETRSE